MLAQKQFIPQLAKNIFSPLRKGLTETRKKHVNAQIHYLLRNSLSSTQVNDPASRPQILHHIMESRASDDNIKANVTNNDNNTRVGNNNSSFSSCQYTPKYLSTQYRFFSCTSISENAFKCEWKNLLVEKHENVALIKLNRPKALNALNSELRAELLDCMQLLENDDDIRCIVLTGNGDKAFAAGADIKEMKNLEASQAAKMNFLEPWNKLQSFTKPLIGAVNGYALGGGCELAMMCDILFASEKARFGQPEILIGTIPGMGGSQRLTKIAGKSTAMYYILTGQQFDAYEALRIGVVTRIFPHDNLVKESLAVAASIAKLSQPAVMLAKEAVKFGPENGINKDLDFERRLFHLTFSLKDQKEGMNAFVEKKPPMWTHS